MRVRFGALALPVEGYAAVNTASGAAPRRLHGPPAAPLPAQRPRAGQRGLPVWHSGLLPALRVRHLPAGSGVARLAVRHAAAAGGGGGHVAPRCAPPTCRRCARCTTTCMAGGPGPWRGPTTGTGIPRARPWSPGAEICLASRGDVLTGYAVIREEAFGWRRDHLLLDEVVARDLDTARAAARRGGAARAAARLRAHRVPRAGRLRGCARAARAIGCEVLHRHYAAAGGMAALLDRGRFLAELRPELARRAAAARVSEAAQMPALAALRDGVLLPDHGRPVAARVRVRALRPGAGGAPRE